MIDSKSSDISSAPEHSVLRVGRGGAPSSRGKSPLFLSRLLHLTHCNPSKQHTVSSTNQSHSLQVDSDSICDSDGSACNQSASLISRHVIHSSVLIRISCSSLKPSLVDSTRHESTHPEPPRTISIVSDRLVRGRRDCTFVCDEAIRG